MQKRSRIPELLTALKNEYEQLMQESANRLQEEEYERKLQHQLQELNNIQKTLFELDCGYRLVREKYEEEISKLKQLTSNSSLTLTGTDLRSSVPQTNNTANPSSNHFHSPVLTQPIGIFTRSGPFPPSSLASNSAPSLSVHLNPSATPDPLHSVISKQSKLEFQPEDSQLPKLERKHPDQDYLITYNHSVKTGLNIELIHTLKHNEVVCSVGFSASGLLLATGTHGAATVFDVKTGEIVHKETVSPEMNVRSVAFSPNNRFLVMGTEDKLVRILDLETKTIKTTLTGHESSVFSVDFSRDGRLIVSGSGDKHAKIWNAETGECLFTLGNEEVGPKDEITSVAFSPDSRLVATASLDRIIRLWDSTTGYFLERYEGHLDSAYSISFSPDGKYLASASLDKTVKLWDLSGSRSRSRCRSTFNGHKDFVLSVAFSPDGQYLISGSKDETLQFWDPSTATSYAILQGHTNSVICVATNPVLPLVATGSGDHTCRIWKYRA